EEMLEAARRATGLCDFGDDWFRGPPGAWAADLRVPHLNDFGRSFLRSLAVRDLAQGLRVLQTLREHPKIAEGTIPPIVCITGLERSGTTLLHDLLALHADARALMRWELMEPVAPPGAAPQGAEPRISVHCARHGIAPERARLH
ncbi:MAG TPA: sulfotransferase, partial [Burkholderiaceae bacterium]|nr:sulfotransferase [Burkholderiaceae bacterium]